MEESTASIPSRIWAVSPGEKSKYWDEFREGGFICVPLIDPGNLKNFSDSKELEETIISKYRDRWAPGERPTNIAGYSLKFANSVEIKDMVVAKSGRRKILGAGYIRSEYKHEPKTDFPNKRYVTWQVLETRELPKNLTFPDPAFIDISDYKDLVDFILQYMEGTSERTEKGPPGGGGEVPLPDPLDLKPNRAVTFPDTVSGKDLLGTEEEVKPFAALMAAQQLEPPLSIGLFGDWGTGKSFFMGRLRKRISRIAHHARKIDDPKKRAFHQRIIQIEFNAWHYVESNLWASIVEHIFRNLKSEGEPAATTRERREELLKKLESGLTIQAAKQAELDDRLAVRESVESKLQLKREQQELAVGKLSITSARNVWDVITVDEETKNTVTEGLKLLGVDRVVESGQELRDAMADCLSLRSRTELVANSVFKGPNSWIRIGLLLVVLAGIPLLLQLINDEPGWEFLQEGFTKVAVWLTTLAGWATWIRVRVGGILHKIETANQKISVTFSHEEAALKEKVKELEKAYEECEVEYEQAAKELVELDSHIESLRGEIKELSAGHQLSQFIANRAKSGDYREHLGLLAMIREDFEKLDQLMRDVKEEDRDRIDEAKMLSEAYRIDRIILYIDDLDRCPPERVVEVLQAVHLLLAFPLFVVVVGVDSRWISTSLSHHYSHLLGDLKGAGPQVGPNGHELKRVEPQDYLEKIFQIPYWIKKMDEKSTSRFLEGLLSDSIAEPLIVTRGKLSTDQKKDEETSEALLPPPSGAPPEIIVKSKKDLQKTAPISQLEAEEIDMDPNQIKLEEIELQCMQDLAGLIKRSPRATKRFVNVYQLIKASLFLEETESIPRNQFIMANGEKSSPFHAVQLLLAVLVGLPKISKTFFDALSAGTEKPTLGEFLELDIAKNGFNKIRIALSVERGHNRNVELIRQLDLALLKICIPLVSRYSYRVGDLQN